MTTFVFYKINMAAGTYNVGEIVVGVAGLVMGVVFWGVEYRITFGGIIWSVLQSLLYGLSLKTGLSKYMNLFLIIMLISKIIILLGFICLILGLNYGLAVGIVTISIVICCLLGVINMYYLNKSYLPKVVKYGTGLVIVGIVVGLALVGFLMNVLSDFTVFTILMAVIIIALLIVYLLIYFNKWAN